MRLQASPTQFWGLAPMACLIFQGSQTARGRAEQREKPGVALLGLRSLLVVLASGKVWDVGEGDAWKA